MNAERFVAPTSGQLVPITGLTGEPHAFVPAPLPPAWPWPAELWPLLVEARTALARLEGTGRHLRSPELLQTPLQAREAQKSSSLEGTVTDPLQQALFQLDPVTPQSAGDPANEFREVFNYRQALRHRRAGRGRLPLSLRLIRELHGVLMRGVRGSDKRPGEFRRYQNQIGRPARYVPPPAERLPELLDNFEKSLHAPWGVDPLVHAFIMHYQFESIHPFMDGNGRVGRLLLALCIAEWCGLEDQWLYMSAYFDAHRDDYMNALLAVSTEGRWSEWIGFCLTGVVQQAADTQRRCDALLKLHRKYATLIEQSRGSARLAAIVDRLFESPVVRVTDVRTTFRVTYPTARADLSRLAALGILRPVPDAAQLTYYCQPILRITTSDAVA